MGLTHAQGVTPSMPSISEGHSMVREARKQVQGVYLLHDQGQRDLVAAWAALDDGRSVAVWRERSNGSTKVTVRCRRGRRAKAPMCLRDALAFFAKGLAR